ncbi:MAG: sigma-70 family RNA polymerase sigma factor [Planctomycetaceae bacterium]
MSGDTTPPTPSLRYLEQVTQSQRTLYGVLWSLLRDAHDVDDVLQETNAVLWQKAHEFDESREFLPWALKIAQLQVLALRKRKQRSRLTFDDQLVAALVDQSIQDAEQVEPRRRVLAECLKKLANEHRRLITRRYEPGGSVNELAAEQGKAPKAVSEMLRRIRSSLLDCIERTLAREAHP